MGIKHYIRLAGDHTSHDDGAVLGVVEHGQVNNPHVVDRAHAYNLVSLGKAYWVAPTSAAAPAYESHAEQADRHMDEHEKLLAKHAAEHEALMQRHADEAKALAPAIAATTGLFTGM
jgi:hypothetical protein